MSASATDLSCKEEGQVMQIDLFEEQCIGCHWLIDFQNTISNGVNKVWNSAPVTNGASFRAWIADNRNSSSVTSNATFCRSPRTACQPWTDRKLLSLAISGGNDFPISRCNQRISKIIIDFTASFALRSLPGHSLGKAGTKARRACTAAKRSSTCAAPAKWKLRA